MVDKEIKVLELESKLNNSCDQARIFQDLFEKVQTDLNYANTELKQYKSMTQSFILKDLVPNNDVLANISPSQFFCIFSLSLIDKDDFFMKDQAMKQTVDEDEIVDSHKIESKDFELYREPQLIDPIIV